MDQNKRSIAKIGRIFILVLLFSLLLVPATVIADLPPRPIPVIVDTDDDDDKDEDPVGAQIHLSGGAGGSSAVVQWLGSDGNWHDVDGWRSTYAGSATWWVAPKDFGTGPFRWVVYNGSASSKTIVAQSESFTLPSGHYQSTQVFAASVQ
ncbi:MAG: hypothetical protein AAF629_07045 [Chloroflexota bacterium]